MEYLNCYEFLNVASASSGEFLDPSLTNRYWLLSSFTFSSIC